MRRAGALGLAGVLLPSALLLHEAVYAFSGEAPGAAHGYLAAALPLIVAAAGSLLAAALLLPLLGLGGEAERSRLRPFTIAAALIGVFGLQESVEAFALGGGIEQLAAAFAAAWLLLPVSIALGVLGAALVEWLERAGQGLARLFGARRERPPRPARAPRPRGEGSPRVKMLSPLAFGLARRPPPGGSAEVTQAS